MRKIRNKLDINFDYFLSDKAKIAYIKEYLGGNTFVNFQPYLRNFYPDKINLLEKLLIYLYNKYYYYIISEKAFKEFNNLRM